MLNKSGSLHLFRAAGINVFLHWTWFLVAAWMINRRMAYYTSFLWNVLEYLSLFGLVLAHEFGHALACRSVGGRANTIMLWPLGGVAFVDPPQRPGAILWSIFAGPLVNILLIPILRACGPLDFFSFQNVNPNMHEFCLALYYINWALLIFNLLPIFPLDGGQILRALLWFLMGPARSLLVTTILGFVGVFAMFIFALKIWSIWFVFLAVFVLLNCIQALRQALAMRR